jgi:hypothetical protein
MNIILSRSILHSESEPLITRYNPAMKVIDVKSSGIAYRNILSSEKQQVSKIFACTSVDASKLEKDFDRKKLEFRTNDAASGVGFSNYDVFHIRHISDYCYAVDNIKKVIDKYKYTGVKYYFANGKSIVKTFKEIEQGESYYRPYKFNTFYKKTYLEEEFGEFSTNAHLGQGYYFSSDPYEIYYRHQSAVVYIPVNLRWLECPLIHCDLRHFLCLSFGASQMEGQDHP